MRIDPLGAYNFTIALVDSSGTPLGAVKTLVGAAVGGFSECSGLETTLETEDFREGGNNGKALKFPTRVTWSSIRLRRGMALSDDLWLWHRSFVEGKGKRRDGIIALQNDLRIPIRIWIFRRGLPVKWTGPSLDAAQSRVAIEELDIGHEGLELVSAGTAIAAGVEAVAGLL